MKKKLIIFPIGDFSNKLMALIGALEISNNKPNIKINKVNKKNKVEMNDNQYNINIIYTLQLNDLFFDKTYFMDNLPPIEFSEISYSYLENKEKTLSHTLNNLLNINLVDEKVNNLSKKKNLKIHKNYIVENKFPSIDEGIISNTLSVTLLTVGGTDGVLTIHPGKVNGEIKIILTTAAAGGTYYINTANVAGDANVQFDTVGDTATLMYEGDDWFVIGGTANVV